ncbi:MAG: RhuM family protein [Methanimicrococcus sp.]|nr:RhuM family protein [Methanimicrococcus sp.]
MNLNESEILMYQSEDGTTKIDVRMIDETVWLSLDQMAELFQRDKSTISKHIKNVFNEGELLSESTVAKYATVQNEGNRSVERQIEYFNLDVIIYVGYRVKSLRGTQFRIWATERLREYIVKGFTMNDFLKKAGGGNYWRELLDRIRDIRSGEKVFYRQLLDLYATSVDYNPKADQSLLFF